MKKVLCLITTLVIMICAVSTASFTLAHADLMEDECDSIFFQTLNEIVADEGIVTNENTITKEVVYDLNLDPLGYIYYIDLEQTDGFAMAVNTDGIYQITEIYLDAEDPFSDYEGQKVYINTMFYAVWDGENFIETSKGIIIDPTDEIFAENVLYAYDYTFYYSNETIYYTNRVKNEYGICKRHPSYLPIGLTNGCVPTAGANIIGFFTRFYPELIPGFEPGMAFGDDYFYYTSASEITPVLATLAEYMGTNVGKEGTNIDGFKNGMKRYCSEKGRTFYYTSCMTSGKFDFEFAKTCFEVGQPAVMFVNSFTIATLTNYDNYERAEYISATAPHAMAGFGYSEITYTLNTGKTRKDNYIMVATGLTGFDSGYFNVNNIDNIDNFYTVNII